MDNEILKMKNISKDFPGVKALDSVNLSLREGEVHALCGANGAGKSTLIKILAGVFPPNEGTIELFGKEINFSHPHEAKEAGISVIYQEYTLFPELDVAKNIHFGIEPRVRNSSFINWQEVYSSSERLIERFNFSIPTQRKIKDLSVAEQQIVEILKALENDAKIIVMDEPTASLASKEVEELFKIIKELKTQNKSIIYISHRLDEITQISDRITVLRNGKKVGERDNKDISKDEIISMMVGDNTYIKRERSAENNNEIVLEVKNLRNNWLNDVNFTLQKGEVLGLAGLVGARRTELARALFGVDTISSGEIFVNNHKVTINHPNDAISLGLGYLPENRKSEGLLLNLDVQRNISYVILKNYSKFLLIDDSLEKAEAEQKIKLLNIKTPSTNFPVLNLSGVNQQKVVFAKWLSAKSTILILDEPTRGIDVGAKEEIFQIINNLTKKGVSIIFISSELEEVMRISDRIVTMYKGEVTANIDRKEATVNKLMKFITGVDREK